MSRLAVDRGSGQWSNIKRPQAPHPDSKFLGAGGERAEGDPAREWRNDQQEHRQAPDGISMVGCCGAEEDGSPFCAARGNGGVAPREPPEGCKPSATGAGGGMNIDSIDSVVYNIDFV
jgi:hypothetical protein